jgi:hypothetical protein
LKIYFNKIFSLESKKQKKKAVSPPASSSDTSSAESTDQECNDCDLDSVGKSKKYKIPKLKFGKRTAAEIKRMRVDFPNLSHHPDETFRTLSWTELIRLDSKLENSAKSSKKLTERLAKNLEKLKKNPVKVDAGEDNRADVLHEARFLGGHTCRHTEIWLKARSSIGLSGIEPVSRYDSEALGMSNFINSHIWAQLHNPGSKEISIKMLSPQALKLARGSSDKDGASTKKDFDSVSDITVALTSLTNAVHCVHPWNFSVAALNFFLTTVQFGEKDIANKNQRISFLTDYIDEVLLHNAEAWDDSKPFLTAPDLSSKWLTAIMMKFPRAGPSKTVNEKPQSQKKDNGTGSNNVSAAGPSKLNGKQYVPPGVCRRFNYNFCPNQSDTSCPAPWDTSKTLRHVCAYWDPKDRTLCQQNHSLLDHK